MSYDLWLRLRRGDASGDLVDYTVAVEERRRPPQ
jgi:hypothetical protein